MHGHAWSDVEYLLAVIADRVAEGTFVTGRGAQMKGLHRPKPVPRPGDEHKGRIGDRAGRSAEDVIAYLDTFKPDRSAATG